MNRGKLFFLVALVVLFSFTLVAAPAAGKPFYEGKTIRLINTASPGGGEDFYSRAVAKCIGKELPGSTVIVKNVPGAGHIIGCNAIYRSKPNGLTFGIIPGGLISVQMLGKTKDKFDLTKMNYLGCTGIAPLSIFITTKKCKTWDELKKADKILIVLSGRGSVAYTLVNLLRVGAGIKNFKLLTGYSGGEKDLALIRGDAHGMPVSWNAEQPLLKQGIAYPIIFFGTPKPKGYEHVPCFREVITDKKYECLVDYATHVGVTFMRTFVAPPGMPSDRLQALRKAFANAVQGAEYEALMKKAGRPAGYVPGEKAKAIMKSLLQLPAEDVEMIKSAIQMK